jgi:hypothetical protein
MEPCKFDVFVSHNHKHKPWVRGFVADLRSSGLTVFFDEDSISPGADVVTAIENAISASRHIVAVLSHLAISSHWVALEIAMTISDDPSAQNNRLIPVLIEDIPLKELRPSIRRLNIIDLSRPENHDDRYQFLLKHLASAVKHDATTPEGHHAGQLSPAIMHPLPPAPRFVGRSTELKFLATFWNNSTPGVLSLVGIGGAGKTAIASRFLAALLSSAENAPEAVFVWSFYEEPDTEIFLQQCFEYFSGQKRIDARGAGWFHLLRDALADGRRNLLILDGLERVQYEHGSLGQHSFGELQDRLLRGLLERIADGCGNTRAIITSRFPVVDLERWEGIGYWSLDVDEIDETSAVQLLRSHGLKGDDGALHSLLDSYGRHAITLDHLGSLIRRFFHGDTSQAPKVKGLPLRGRDAQARRLGAIFNAYEKLLAPEDLAVLSRLCVFRFGVDAELLSSVYGQVDSDVAGPLARMTQLDVVERLDSLVSYHLVLRENNGSYTVHPAVRDYFYQTFANVKDMHNAVRTRLSDLVDRPGAQLPTDRAVLNLLEELIYHSLAAGRVLEARTVYEHRMGGAWHLGRVLGEFARGYRILMQFPEVFDVDGLLRYRRGIGDLPTENEWAEHREKLVCFNLNEHDTMLLLGELPKLSSPEAEFLMGKKRLPNFSADYAPRFSAIVRSPRLEEGGFEGSPPNRATGRLWSAELEIRRRNLTLAQDWIDRASEWILSSGSQEHLCIFHLTRARLAFASQNWGAAESALTEGLLIATKCRFRIFQIDLLLVRGEAKLRSHDKAGARAAAADALRLAEEASCQYALAAADARALLAKL